MKKTTKMFLETSLVMFIVGAVIALSAFLFIKIKGIDAYGTENLQKNVKTYSYTVEQISHDSPNSSYKLGLSDALYKQINIRLYNGNVSFKKTDKPSYIEFNGVNVNNISSVIEGDILTVRENNAVGSFGLFVGEDGIKFKGLRQIFGSGMSATPNQEIILNINPDDIITNLNIDVTIGDVNISDISAFQANIKNEAGNISVNNSLFATKISIVADFSDISISNNEYQNAAIQTKKGKIEAHLPECKSSLNTVIENWAGDCKVITDVPTSYYKINCATKIGNVKLNKQNVDKNFLVSSQNSNRISINSILGNISVDFSGPDENAFAPKIFDEPEIINEIIPVDEPVISETNESVTQTHE